MNVGVP